MILRGMCCFLVLKEGGLFSYLKVELRVGSAREERGWVGIGSGISRFACLLLCQVELPPHVLSLLLMDREWSSYMKWTEGVFGQSRVMGLPCSRQFGKWERKMGERSRSPSPNACSTKPETHT